ncbi:MAG: hypothetical protein ACP5P1_11210 [Acidimicrobiales bacterium]
MRSSPEASRRLPIVLGALVLASVLSACGASKTSTATKSVAAQWTLPTASSTITPDGVWATVAMGHLGDPLNTFWQLPFRQAGRATWTNQVEATATATNGGLILASAGGTLLVGIRPSVDLTFSPLISTGTGGLKWSSGLLDTALIPAAGSLAVKSNVTASPAAASPATASAGAASTVTASAVTSASGGDSKVESDEGSLSSWRTVGDLRSLDLSAAGRGCDATSLTAVGYSGTNLVVGAACANAGSNGLFTLGADGWQATGPALSASAGSTVTVLAAASQGNGQPAASPEAFLLGLTGPAGEPPRLVVASSSDGTDWQVSPAMSVASTTAVVSFGPAPGGGLFVLARGPGGAINPYVTDGPGAQWRQLPDAPPGTATLAKGHGGTLEALSVNDTALSFWTLEPAGDKWVRSQTMHVNIEFGSSNP